MKKIAILYSEYTPIIDAIIGNNQEEKFELFNEIPQNINEFDLIVDVNFTANINKKCLKLHYSLLPAFENDLEPVKSAFLIGVKVTGLTIYYTNPREIIAQYPIFINALSHYDEIIIELEYLAQTILPIVIKKILKNEIFDLKNIIQTNKVCGGCTTCRK